MNSRLDHDCFLVRLKFTPNSLLKFFTLLLIAVALTLLGFGNNRTNIIPFIYKRTVLFDTNYYMFETNCY